MDSYNAVIRIAKERPQYVDIVKKCIKAHRNEEKKKHSLGFEWNDAGVLYVKSALLATEYDFLKVTYKSNSATCYMVKDIEGAKKAVQDIEMKRISMRDKQDRPLKIWLSSNT